MVTSTEAPRRTRAATCLGKTISKQIEIPRRAPPMSSSFTSSPGREAPRVPRQLAHTGQVAREGYVLAERNQVHLVVGLAVGPGVTGRHKVGRVERPHLLACVEAASAVEQQRAAATDQGFDVAGESGVAFQFVRPDGTLGPDDERTWRAGLVAQFEEPTVVGVNRRIVQTAKKLIVRHHADVRLHHANIKHRSGRRRPVEIRPARDRQKHCNTGHNRHRLTAGPAVRKPQHSQAGDHDDT